MSLINKMLQDLDSRGTAAGEGMPAQVRAVARARPKPRWPLVGAATGAAVAAIAAGWFVLVHEHPAAPAVVTPAAPAAGPANGMRSTISMTPVGASGNGAVNGAGNGVPANPAAVPAGMPADSAAGGVTAPAAVTPAAMAAARQESATSSEPAHEAFNAPGARSDMTPAPAARPETASVVAARPERAAAAAVRSESVRAAAPPRAAAAPITAEPLDPFSDEARAARAAIAQVLAARAAMPLPRDAHARAPAAIREEDAAAKARRAVPGRQETGTQRAEAEYRRALASLQEGRTNETVDALEQALKYDPAHEAARQTLVGLLIEAKRTDEAMRQLQLGLTQDARQPALAMLLARLQIERGGSGIETLQRTLPYAGNDADYHAFMAAALARQGRHRDAAEQYQQAVRAAPSNGVWWMGLGMSLEADKRNGEALDAFQKARASGALSADLQAFVERRIQQLGR
jgi:MSHA biogenesis protein MshN